MKCARSPESKSVDQDNSDVLGRPGQSRKKMIWWSIQSTVRKELRRATLLYIFLYFTTKVNNIIHDFVLWLKNFRAKLLSILRTGTDMVWSDRGKPQPAEPVLLRHWQF